MKYRYIVACSLLLILAGCGGAEVPPTQTPVVMTPTSVAPSATVPTPTLIPTELPPTATTGPTGQVVAPEKIIEDFKAAGLPIGETVIFTAENDPNKLLGRPGGYIAKATWHDTRLTRQPTFPPDPGTPTPSIPDIDISREGAGLEIFADETSAERREDYLEALYTGGGIFGTEYIYRRGIIILRVGGDLTPTQAEDYKKAFDSLSIP